MKILLTGANGFLGWHTRVRLQALTEHEVVAINRANWTDIASLATDADAIIHVAGVNRGSDREVVQANIDLAQTVAAAARTCKSPPRIVYANSIQSGNSTPYGIGKENAAKILAEAAKTLGSAFVDIRLPNLFGEHGRPQYNSFVATFVNAVINDKTPQIDDRQVNLLHVQKAARVLIDGLSSTATRLDPVGTTTTISEVFDTLKAFRTLYASGDIPPLLSELNIDLFNTLRAAQFPSHYPIGLTPRIDNRGSLIEVVRAHGGQGQTFVSTTKPGITRGEHFHLRKIERFAVISGRARISLRKLFSNEIISFDITGDSPAVVDMPTMWVHNITNTGDEELVTLFWTHELFDPKNPDTYQEKVDLSNVDSGTRNNGE